MLDNNEYVSTRPNGVRDYCGIGNAIIPKDKDRDKYIEQCFRRGTVSIVLENGGVIDNVQISKSAIKDLDFPDTYKGLGSQVVWINKPRQNQPIIIGIFNKNNEFVNINEKKDSLRKSSSKGVNEVIVDSNNGIIVVNSSSFVESGGDIYIISTNKKKSSKMSIKVSGSIPIETTDFSVTSANKTSFIIKDATKDDKVTSIIYEKNIGFSYKDEFGNEIYLNKDNIQFKPIGGKFNIGEGTEPMILGSTFQEQVNKDSEIIKVFLQVLQTPITEPGNGAPSAFQATLLAALKILQTSDYSNILSKVSNTD